MGRQTNLALPHPGAHDNRGVSLQSNKKAGAKHAMMPKTKAPPALAEVGLVLVDEALNVIAFDWGAAAILSYRSQATVKVGSASGIPEEILEIIRGRAPADRSSSKTHLRMGQNEYICRTYLLESQNGPLLQSIVALHLERDSTANDAMSEIVARYHLTEREQEVLSGISLGLATKELADRMNISPNTVKAFLRLVMIKMGVTSRAGIIAKILHNGSDPAALPETAARVKKRGA